jgi:hypothetical protein
MLPIQSIDQSTMHSFENFVQALSAATRGSHWRSVAEGIWKLDYYLDSENLPLPTWIF